MGKRRILIFCLLIAILGAFAVGAAAVAETEGFVAVENYSQLQSALEAADGTPIKLLGNIDATAKPLVVQAEAVLDLNGFDITGSITVSSGKTLYCMDSQTDDCTINDANGYGKILATISRGSVVKGLPQSSNFAEHGYLMVTEKEGISFHMVNLTTTAMTLRAEHKGELSPGVYYTCTFAGDEMVKANVKMYGVALSLAGEPNENNITTKCRTSKFTEFNSGIQGNAENGTILYGILKQKNTDSVNQHNAVTPIYGRAYLLTKNDEYLFGNVAQRTFQEQVEDANDNWESYDETAKKAGARMLLNYYSVMKNWDTDAIAKTASPSNDDELNILMVGSSFCYYYVEELYGLLAERYPDKTIRVCNVYQSGCTLQKRATQWQNGEVKEYYYETDASGRKAIYDSKKGFGTIDACLDRYYWDVVSLQEGTSTIYRPGAETHFQETQTYLKALLDYIKEKAPFARHLWHAPWSYDIGTTQGGYVMASEEQQQSNAAEILKYGKMVCEKYDLEMVNTGDAWQIVRNGGTGAEKYNTLCARTHTTNNLGDYQHDGDIGGGQYLNACVWFEIITGQSCVGNKYRPNYTLNSGITYETLQQAAHKAVADYKAANQ